MCQFFSNMLFNVRRSVLFVLVIVLAVVEANAQEHIFNTFYIQSPLIKDSKSISSSSSQSSESSSEESTEADTDITTKKPLAEVPKTTMDIITVIWYLSTFLALAAFFFLMACSDRRCGRRRMETDQLPVAPPTPAPSYSEFAPPSYESVIKQSHNIYVVPVHGKVAEKNTKDIQFHTINELQKIG